MEDKQRLEELAREYARRLGGVLSCLQAMEARTADPERCSMERETDQLAQDLCRQILREDARVYDAHGCPLCQS